MTQVYQEAGDPLQNISAQISIWGHLGSQGSNM